MIAHANDVETNNKHIPVMMDEVLAALAPKKGETYVDGTFGAGGYTRAILSADECHVIAVDRDPDAIARSAPLSQEFGDRFQIVEGCFGDMADLLASIDVRTVDGIVLDIGVSSFQLDEAERGFSFNDDGPLDMRMSAKGTSAADVVNSFEEEELANLIYQYGEERKSRRVASAIVRRRAETPFTRTRDLALTIESVLGRAPVKKGRKAIHPATRTFQALRIYVNDELGELERVLDAAEALLAPEGKLVVVCFHSLEDRIVKSFMAERSGRVPSASRHMPMSADARPSPSFTLLTKGAQKPTPEEEKINSRSRSARLRAAMRTTAAPMKKGGGYA